MAGAGLEGRAASCEDFWRGRDGVSPARDKHGLFWGVAFPLMLMRSSVRCSAGTNLGTTSVVPTPAIRWPELTEALGQTETLRGLRPSPSAGGAAPGRPQPGGGAPIAEVVVMGGTAPVRVLHEPAMKSPRQASPSRARGRRGQDNDGAADVDRGRLGDFRLQLDDVRLPAPGRFAMVLMQNGFMGVTAVLTAYRSGCSSGCWPRPSSGLLVAGGPLHHHELAARRHHRPRGRAGVPGAVAVTPIFLLSVMVRWLLSIGFAVHSVGHARRRQHLRQR